MTSNTIELVEHVRRQLTAHENACEIVGPAPEEAIAAAEEALGCTFPPSYRSFLSTFGGIAIPPHMGVVHDFVGVRRSAKSTEGAGGAAADDVVGRTLRAREERRLSENLVVVGMGAQFQEWFCLDLNRPTAHGEYAVVLYDARDNAVDQPFYDDFGQMLREVMGFVADNLDHPLD